MTEATKIQDHPGKGVQGAGNSPRGLLLRAAVIAAIPVLMLVLAMAIIYTPFWDKYCDSDELDAQKDIYTSANRPCDVLIFGDSTAMAGLDPRIISAKTHLSTCNIAIPVPSLSVVGTQPLDLYLQRNPRPKYLLFQFYPGSIAIIRAGINESGGIVKRFDPMAYMAMLRYGQTSEGLSRMLARPDSFIAVMALVYVRGPENILALLKHQRSKAPLSEPGAGAYIVMQAPPLTSCPQSYPYAGMGAANVDWIAQLRPRYASRAGKVLLNVSPSSVCNPWNDSWSRDLAGHIDNSLRLYQNDLFVDNFFHPTREAAIRESNETADQILALENQSSSARSVSP